MLGVSEQPYRQQSSFWSKLLASSGRSSTCQVVRNFTFEVLFPCRYIHAGFIIPLMLATWPGFRECSAELFIICAPVCVCTRTVLFPGGAWWGQRFFTVLLIWVSLGIGREVSKIYSEARTDGQPITSSLSLGFLLMILQVFILKSLISKAKKKDFVSCLLSSLTALEVVSV